MECVVCGTETGNGSVGRPRMYCSAACKQRAYRSRAWQGTPRQSGALRQRATALACALAGKAAYVHVLLMDPGPAPAGLSAGELAEAVLADARELLRVLGSPAGPREPGAAEGVPGPADAAECPETPLPR